MGSRSCLISLIMVSRLPFRFKLLAKQITSTTERKSGDHNQGDQARPGRVRNQRGKDGAEVGRSDQGKEHHCIECYTDSGPSSKGGDRCQQTKKKLLPT